MSIGEAFLLNLVAVCVAVGVGVVVLFWVVSLVWAAWTFMTTKEDAGRPLSTLDRIGQDLSRLDEVDGLGRELR